MSKWVTVWVLVIASAFTCAAQKRVVVPPVADTGNPYKPFYTRAQFYGGDSCLQQYFKKHIKYPLYAKEAGIEGRVMVRFLVDEHGALSRPTIVRGVDKVIDEEALRVVNAMPAWVPASYKNKPVRSLCTLPVIFKLE